MNAVATPPSPNSNALVPWHQLAEEALFSVLETSVYPGAKRESILAVIGTCRASGKDPLKKPYHIVPMWGTIGRDDRGKEIKGMRDVIMPGIADYRIEASRTGEHVGTSEPEFGPTIDVKLDNQTYSVPEWCRVTVRRRKPDGTVAEFTAKEFWLENYATAKRDVRAPNAMWRKRPFGQLAKCAEAQALRKGFPEAGNLATAEEMVGKDLDDDNVIEGEVTRVVERPKALEQQAAGEKIEDAEVSEVEGQQAKAPEQNRQQEQRQQQDRQDGQQGNERPTPGLVTTIVNLAKKKKINKSEVEEVFKLPADTDFEQLSEKVANDILAWVMRQDARP